MYNDHGFNNPVLWLNVTWYFGFLNLVFSFIHSYLRDTMLGGVIELVYIQLHAQLRIWRRSQALVHVFVYGPCPIPCWRRSGHFSMVCKVLIACPSSMCLVSTGMFPFCNLPPEPQTLWDFCLYTNGPATFRPISKVQLTESPNLKVCHHKFPPLCS